MECWGASGGTKPQGSGSASPGVGGYTSGIITLKQNLYVFVGSVGTNSFVRNNNPGGWNGGGYGGSNQSSVYEDAGSGGGGSTDIRITNGTWDDIVSLRSRIMAAAGGGGCCYATHTSSNNSGGAGGGLTGESGKSNHSTYGASKNENTGGSQTAHGTGGSELADGYTVKSASGSKSYGGGGGGGWYGGVAGIGRGGSGGSSFISGMTGCNGIDSSTGTHRGASQPSIIDGVTYNFSSPVMYAGNSTSRPTNPGGTNGYARITSQ